MLARWLSAFVGIPLFLGLGYIGGTPFAIGVLVVAALALGELLRGYRANGIQPNPCWAICGLLLVAYPAVVCWYSPATENLADGPSAGYMRAFEYVWIAAILLIVAGPVYAVIRAARTGEMTVGRDLGIGALSAGYVGLFSALTWLRMLYYEAPLIYVQGDSSWWQPLFVTLFCVWATDSFAFFVGSAFGKRKLAPALSPGKTVEGAIGGLAASLLVGALFGWGLMTWQGGLLIGAIAGVFGQVGDLFESALKREIGIKDFGGILPGHGGILDRFDSLLFVAPIVALVWWMFYPFA